MKQPSQPGLQDAVGTSGCCADSQIITYQGISSAHGLLALLVILQAAAVQHQRRKRQAAAAGQA